MPVRSRRSFATCGKRRQLAIASVSNDDRAVSPRGTSIPAAAPDAYAPGVARSSSVTAQPVLASSYAVAQPMIPPPTTTIFTSRRRQRLQEPPGRVGRRVRGENGRHDGDAARPGRAHVTHACGCDPADRDDRQADGGRDARELVEPL